VRKGNQTAAVSSSTIPHFHGHILVPGPAPATGPWKKGVIVLPAQFWSIFATTSPTEDFSPTVERRAGKHVTVRSLPFKRIEELNFGVIRQLRGV